MIIIYGSSLLGQVDELEGLFCVKTKFAHIFWLPLIPLGSHIVLEETDAGWRGVPFGLCLRSVLDVLAFWVRIADNRAREGKPTGLRTGVT